jgi:hypothetical protein
MTLNEFVRSKMRTSAPYQPMIIKYLVEHKGIGRVLDIAKGDTTLAKRLGVYPPGVLRSHNVATFDDGTFYLNPAMTIENKAEIISICNEIISKY